MVHIYTFINTIIDLSALIALRCNLMNTILLQTRKTGTASGAAPCTRLQRAASYATSALVCISVH